MALVAPVTGEIQLDLPVAELCDAGRRLPDSAPLLWDVGKDAHSPPGSYLI